MESKDGLQDADIIVPGGDIIPVEVSQTMPQATPPAEELVKPARIYNNELHRI